MASFLEQEIYEQPMVLARLLDSQWGTAQQIAASMRRFDPAFVCIAARGTSDNAARYAQYLFGITSRLPVGLATPSIHTLYEASPNLSRAVVIGISQSGQSADVCRVVQDAREQGALTVGITNDPASPIGQAAEYHLALEAGPEQSVAATKTYTAQLMAVAMIGTALADSAEMLAALKRVPDYAGATLKLSEMVRDWVERYRYISQFVSIGRGYNYCTAFEISLKVKELCYVSGNGYSEADFLHGPIAELHPGFPVMVVAPEGRTLGAMTTFLEKLRERSAEALLISNAESLFSAARKVMRLPKDMPEWLTPIPAVIPGQMFAMLLAAARGNPLDQPHGLTKVTYTL